jgi:hypothetical protein
MFTDLAHRHPYVAGALGAIGGLLILLALVHLWYDHVALHVLWGEYLKAHH